MTFDDRSQPSTLQDPTFRWLISCAVPGEPVVSTRRWCKLQSPVFVARREQPPTEHA